MAGKAVPVVESGKAAARSSVDVERRSEAEWRCLSYGWAEQAFGQPAWLSGEEIPGLETVRKAGGVVSRADLSVGINPISRRIWPEKRPRTTGDQIRRGQGKDTRVGQGV